MVDASHVQRTYMYFMVRVLLELFALPFTACLDGRHKTSLVVFSIAIL